jgi:phosphonate transport system ATP-binding protein
MLLKVERLRMQYPKSRTAALQNVSFEVQKGEFIAILGLSGAGKSTLIRCLNLLVKPTNGRISWEGKDVSNISGKALMIYRRSIGMIFQSFNLLGRLTAIQNVLVGRLGYIPLWRALLFSFPADEVQRAHDALTRVGLESFALQRADMLSGGQKQRIGIARALVQNPKLILGDEPVASLDPRTSTSVMDLLASINKEENITLMINLHDVELARKYATRIIGISNGEVVFDGSPELLNDAVLSQIYSVEAAKGMGTEVKKDELKSLKSVY